MDSWKPVRGGRDPFARQTLVRRALGNDEKRSGIGCTWCGQGPRYTYAQDPDAGRLVELVGIYCSIGCMRAYTS